MICNPKNTLTYFLAKLQGYFLYVLFLTFTFSCGNIEQSEDSSSSVKSNDQAEKVLSEEYKHDEGLVEVVKFDAIETLMDNQSGNIQVINFWATWCGPCVKELPYLEKANEKFASKGVEFTVGKYRLCTRFGKICDSFCEEKGFEFQGIIIRRC